MLDQIFSYHSFLHACQALCQIFIFNKPIENACLKTEPDRIINLEENCKLHQALLHKFAPWEENCLKEEILRLLKNNIIRPSNSSWRHFPVIVKKSNGHFRLAINSSMTKRDAFRGAWSSCYICLTEQRSSLL